MAVFRWTFLDLEIDGGQPSTMQILTDDKLFATLIEVGDDEIGVGRLVAEERANSAR